MKNKLIYSLAAILLISCGGPAVTQLPQRSFPKVKLPSLIQDSAQAAEYLALHWWDPLTDTTTLYLTDSTHILGVENSSVEQEMSNYTAILSSIKAEEMRKAVFHFCARLEALELRDPADSGYERLSALFERYLYDPNSPVRNEECYLPYCEYFSASALLDEAKRDIYAHQAAMCSLNRLGTPAADFSFCDRRGRSYSLHGIKADCTLLFFSNPGCNACKDIIDRLKEMPGIDAAISEDRLAVLNIYIDEDLAAWLEYMPIYPENWYNGYDPNLVIRSDHLYDVRAIPSLYLLDSQKRVLMKDAPEDKVLEQIYRRLSGEDFSL